MTWTPATTPPKRAGYYAVRCSWSAVPDIAHYGRDGWRRHGRTLVGVVAWLELPAFEAPEDRYL